MDLRLILTFAVFVLGLLGLIFVYSSKIMSGIRKKDRAGCTEKTEAEIVEVKKVFCDEFQGESGYGWFPVYRYMAGGKLHTVESCIGGLESDFRTGQITVLYYSPGDPERIYVPANNSEKIGRSFLIIGIGLLAAEVIVMLILILLLNGFIL